MILNTLSIFMLFLLSIYSLISFFIISLFYHQYEESGIGPRSHRFQNIILRHIGWKCFHIQRWRWNRSAVICSYIGRYRLSQYEVSKESIGHYIVSSSQVSCSQLLLYSLLICYHAPLPIQPFFEPLLPIDLNIHSTVQQTIRGYARYFIKGKEW